MLYAVKSIELAVPFAQAHGFISDPLNLPKWANAFTQVTPDGKAILATPQGEVPIALKTVINTDDGIVDWFMTFPDGSVGKANSRVVPLAPDSCVYSFILSPPPLPLEELEGALAAQQEILEGELKELKVLLEQ